MARKSEELIKRLQKVGEGTFGTVFIGSYREYKEVGIKDIKGKLSDEAFAEANILKKLTHPHIIQYIDIVQIQNQTSIIMEFIDGGSLLDYIIRTAQSSTYWKTTKQIMIDVAHGMSYLHGERIVHADLKSMNILLRYNYSAVICDFGLARTIVDSRTVATNYASGTELWFAPELCFDRPERSSFPSDVWAYGCILLEIISKKFPWIDTYHRNRDLLNALAKQENAIIFENICLTQRAPKKLRALLCECCSWVKTDRPTFPEIVRELTAVSDIDLQDITQGRKKTASLKDESQDLQTVDNAMDKLNIKKPNAQRKPSRCHTDEPKATSTSEENTRYDEEHKRQLFKGPRGGWYYIGPNGKKVYLKIDTV